MIRTQARQDFCGLPHSPASVCAPVRVHTQAGESAGHCRADAATGPGEPGAGGRGAGVTGWSSRTHRDPCTATAHLELGTVPCGVRGLPTVTQKEALGAASPFQAKAPSVASHMSPSPPSQRTHFAPCVLEPGKSVSFLSLECLLYTSVSLTDWEMVWASRVAQG